MPKFILIAAMVLASASARADEARNLTQGPNDQPVAVEQAQLTAETSSATSAPGGAETQKFIERPSAVDATATIEAPKTGVAKDPVEDPAKDSGKNAIKDPARNSARPVVAQAPKLQKQKHKRYWTEGRVIGELHRHGVYW
jgi:hypothetical protein